MLVFFTSCFLMPLGAPHYHKYIAFTKNEFVNVVEVFDTPKHKTYHFFAKKGLKIKGCSNVFVDSCYTFSYDDFFEDKKYQKTIKIKDNTFLKLMKNDTLKLFVNGKKLLFIPVAN